MKIHKNIFTKIELALMLRKLFDRRELWEQRPDRGGATYRGAPWYTIGTPLYLDLLKPEQFEGYVLKCAYFNGVLEGFAGWFLKDLLGFIASRTPGKKALFLADEIKHQVSYPGFHIFPGHVAGEQFFGKLHEDRQYETLLKTPALEGWKIENPKSYTLPLLLPFLGGGMVGEKPVDYEVGDMYVHDGLFKHAIAPFQAPVLPVDMRITLQAHSFESGGKTWLYW